MVVVKIVTKDLEEEICETDKRMAEYSPLKPELFLFQRLHQPLHFFCRLKDTGYNPHMTKMYSMFYANGIYLPLIADMKKYFGVNENGK